MTRRLLRQLTIPVVPISVLLVGVGGWAAWRVQHLQERVSREVRENVSAMRAAEELEILVREYGTRLEHLRMSGDAHHADSLRQFRAEIDRWVPELARWSFTPREHELAARARQGWESLQGMTEQVTEKPATLTQQDFARMGRVLTEEVLTPTHVFLDLNEEEVEQSVAENQSVANRLVFALLLLGICGAGVGMTAGYWLARRFLERLERSERAALRAEQLAALGHLAAGMAHELHNPLTTIKMLVQAALTENDLGARGAAEPSLVPALTGHDLAVVDDEVTRLEGLVRSFRDFARPPVPERRVVEVGSLVEQTLGLVEVRATAAGVTIELDQPPVGVREAVDPGQLRQVVLNLVLNALDAVKPGGRVDVSLGRDQAGRLEVRVADDGCGLPPEWGPRIFDPFVTTKEAGLGLGLSICKRIAEAHGGTITGVNRPQGGAEFAVRFPANRVGACPIS
jgi:signal transduction histidine kinase